MRGPTTSDAAIGLGAVVAATGVTFLQSAGTAELVFYAVLCALLAGATRSAIRQARTARSQRRRAAELAATKPAEAALAAVREERRRLSGEIAATLREALTRISAEVSGARAEPGVAPRLHAVLELTQHATSELRRHLGLLRSSSDDDPPAGPSSRRRPARRDLVLAAAMTVLGAVEAVVHPRSEGWPDWTPWSVVATACAAACVAGRTLLLGPATVACAAVTGLGSLLGAPVVDGFWTIGSVAVLVWAVASAARTRGEVGGGLVLCGVVVATRWRDSPDNLGMVVALLVLAVLGGLTVRLIRARTEAAVRRADAREEELAVARRLAVGAERVGLARELHDVCSHAVGVIALQAAAAEVTWRTDPAAADDALRLIRTTAAAALEDLDRIGAGEPAAYTMDDVRLLVERIRATGTRVDLAVEEAAAGGPPSSLLHVVHRMVQECLTNALRHAPGAAVSVTVRSDDGAVTVSVADDGPGSGSGENRGYGLVGLTERVTRAGGTLAHGPGPDGRGFRVTARIPVATPAVRS